MTSAPDRVPISEEEPVIGRFYQVPCLERRLVNAKDILFLPVLGPAHRDDEIAKWIGSHWHYDFRFISRRLWGRAYPFLAYDSPRNFGIVESEHPHDGSVRTVVMRRKMCVRQMPEFPVHDPYPTKPLQGNRVVVICQKLCAGKRLDLTTMRCPHRGIPLQGLPVTAEGTVVCPGHGLEFNLTTGEMVDRLSRGDFCHDASGHASLP